MNQSFLQSTVDSVIDEVIERHLASGDASAATGATVDLSNVFEADLRHAAHARLVGYGALQPFIDDPNVEEVWVNQPHEVFIATRAGNQRINIDLNADELAAIVEKMLRTCGRRLDRSTPFVDASLPDGSRLHVIIPSLTRAHWSVNIRKFSPEILSLNALRQSQTLNQNQHVTLREAMLAGKNILVSGATQAGKTTLLCALLNELTHPNYVSRERLVSVEETFEIRSNLPDWVALQARQANLEGVGEVSLRRLIVEALRMRPTRLVVGEVRQAEALDLLIALNSGLPGMCTIHANSAEDAVQKMATLPLLAGANITRDFVVPTVASCIDLVVHCEQIAPGQRRVVEVSSVALSGAGHELVTTHVC